MKFKLTKASDSYGAKGKAVIINSLDDLKKLQEKLIAEEIEDYNKTAKYKVSNAYGLIFNTSFSYELIVDFMKKTIVFYNYWTE